VSRRPLLVALVISVGCASEHTPSPTSSVRDSAGISIIENHRAQWSAEERWRLDTIPELVIGAMEGPPEYQLYQVTGVGSLHDGGVVLALGSAAELRWYGPDGQFVGSAGRPGEGPGEFGYASLISVFPGDTIAVWDIQLRRLSRFAPDGSFLSDKPLHPPSDGWPSSWEILPDGTFIYSLMSPRGEGESLEIGRAERRPIEIWIDPDPSEPAGDEVLLGPFPGFEMVYREAERGSTHLISGGPGIFTVSTHVAVGAGSVFIGDNARYEILRYTLDGDLEAIIRRPMGRTQVTEDMVTMERNGRLARIEDPDDRRRFLHGWDQLPVPDSLPAFSDMRADSEGYLWVREYVVATADTAAWSVFDPTGIWLGEVAIPTEMMVRDISGHWVIGVHRDELGIERVLRYTLIRPGQR